MALDDAHMQALAEIARAAQTASDAATQWRARFPQVRALRQSADDMRGETPALRFSACDVYFVRSGGACLSMTGDARQADALVFTESEGGNGA